MNSASSLPAALQQSTVARLVAIMSLALALIAVMSAPVEASATNTSSRSTVPLDVVVPSEDSCTGEAVRVSGTLDVFVKTTVNRNGTHTVIHNTPHLEGIGLDTGDRYLPVGPLHEVTNVSGPYPVTALAIDHLNLIAPGTGGSLIVLIKSKVTINANGVMTVDIFDVKAACRG
jgi:hypothetical protein